MSLPQAASVIAAETPAAPHRPTMIPISAKRPGHRLQDLPRPSVPSSLRVVLASYSNLWVALHRAPVGFLAQPTRV